MKGRLAGRGSGKRRSQQDTYLWQARTPVHVLGVKWKWLLWEQLCSVATWDAFLVVPGFQTPVPSLPYWPAQWSLFKPVYMWFFEVSVLFPHINPFFLRSPNLPTLLPAHPTLLLLKDPTSCPWCIASAEPRTPETLGRTLGPTNTYSASPLHLQVLDIWFMNISKARDWVIGEPFFLFIEPALKWGSVLPKL